MEALKQGLDQSAIKEKLIQASLSEEQANLTLVKATEMFNAIPAGVVANRYVQPKKAQLVEDPAPRQTLPDPSTIIPQMKDLVGMFEGANTDIDTGTQNKVDSSLEIGETFNRSGIDSVI